MTSGLPDLEHLSAYAGVGIAFTVAWVLVCTQRWHGRFSHDSAQGVQKMHHHPTPRIGGLAIAAGLLSGAVLAAGEQADLLWQLVLCGTPAFVFGLLEDFTKRVSVRARLLATMSCGLLGWLITGHALTQIDVPLLDELLRFTPAAVLFTAFAVGGVANAINIIDGFNGLAAGTVVIALVGLGTLASSVSDAELTGVCLVLAGAVLGFGLVNWPLGKIFLGDGGAYFVGFALAWISVLMKARHPEISAWALMLVCGFPVLEVLFSIWRRLRRQLNPGNPDRLHLHSLVRRRVIPRLLSAERRTSRNSATGALMWFASALPATLALQWPRDSGLLALSFLLCALLYWLVYARLSQFRWCLSGVTLRPQHFEPLPLQRRP